MSGTERRTLRGTPVVEAPGKIFLIGEYAVLHGAPAVVASVNRYAVAQFVPEMAPASPLVAEAVRLAREGLGDRAAALPDGSVLINTEAFASNGRKLGMGSSAAVAVSSVAAVMELAGLPIVGHRDLCFTLADAAHRAAQGGVGSGADVAAAVHGGIIQFTRAAGGYPATQRQRLPAGLRTVVFAEGAPAATPDMVRAVAQLAERDAPAHAACIDRLKGEAETFGRAMAAGDAAGVIASVERYGETMAELGRHAQVPIVTTRFELAAELALNLGGAAKPSGAGGGDVGVAFFPDDAAAATFAQRSDALGLNVLDVRLEAAGVARRQPRSNSAGLGTPME